MLLTAMIPAVQALAAMLGPGNEVLLHDLSRLPDSIIAIAGDVTGRPVGGPMTDLLLGLIRRGTTQDLTNYQTYGPDWRPIRSSTLFIKEAKASPSAVSAEQQAGERGRGRTAAAARELPA